MVLHIVMLKPRPDLTSSNRRDFVAAFDRAIREIPAVRAVRVGRRVTHGADYEQQMPDTADFVAELEFDDVAGVQAYLTHPIHERLGQLFGEMLTAGLVYDFEMTGPDVTKALAEWSA